MIKHIIMNGIKNATDNQRLTGRDIIIGRNGSGKTTRIQAIGIAMLGHVPGGGKLSSEVFKLAKDYRMTVGIETDNITITRVFEQQGMKIDHNLMLDPQLGEKNNTIKEKRIEDEIGKLPVMLNFDEFLTLSDMKRREFIFSLADASSDEWNRDKLKTIFAARLASPDITDEETLAAIKENIDDCIVQYAESSGIQEGLQVMQKYAKEQSAYWRRDRDRAISTAQKMTDNKNEHDETDRNLEENITQYDKLQNDLAMVASEFATAEKENQRIKSQNDNILRLRSEIMELESSVYPVDTAELKERINELNAVVKEIDNSIAIAEKQKSLESIARQIAELSKEMNEKNNERQAILGKKSAADSLLAKIDKQDSSCPIDSRIKCDNDFTGLISELTTETDSYEQDLLKLTGELEDISARLDAENQSENELRTAIEQLRMEETEALRRNNQIGQERQKLEEELRRGEMFENTKTERLSAKQEELKGISLQSGAIEQPLVSIDELTARKQRLNMEIQILGERIDRQRRVRNALVDISKSKKDAEVAARHLNIWNKIAELTGPKGLQGELIKEALLPLTVLVQNKLQQMEVDRTFYFQTETDKGKEIFQFGWTGADGERRNFDALSTGEQLLLLVALMSTIIEKLDPPLKILVIDNAEKLDDENKKRVFNGLAKAGENLDNIIFCGVMNIEPSDVPGWHVWDLSEGVA